MKNTKKIVNIVIIAAVVFTMISISIPTFAKNAQQPKNELTNGDTHHKVIAEMGTATWCPHCPSMADYLAQVSGDFQYISLVADKNGPANQRCSELGLTGYPTCFFDGGFNSVIGHQYSVANLQNAYDQCQARTVADVEISILATIDEDQNTMEVTVFVDNQEDTTYNGHLHAYVTEINSRWLDYANKPYKNALLGYALNKGISVQPESTWSDTGSFYYPDIDKNNILVVATVFSQNNGYTDETATAIPTTSSGGGGGGGSGGPLPTVNIDNPTPGKVVKGITNINGTAHHLFGDGNLKWTFIQIDNREWETAEGTADWNYEWDTTTFDDGEHVIKAISSDGSKQSGTYYVSVIVNNINSPPKIPDAPTGPTQGVTYASYTYKTHTTDEDKDEIRYGWDWNGDLVVDEWTDYISEGDIVETPHIWSEPGLKEVRVKTEDPSGSQTNFSSALEVNIKHSDETPPTIEIIKPVNGIYYNNNKIMGFLSPILIGTIDIEVSAVDEESQIDKVIFYIDGEIQKTDNDGSYSWTWSGTEGIIPKRHTVRIEAYNRAGISTFEEINVLKIL